MIVLQIKTGAQQFTKNILLIDAHSHLGRDEDGLQNMNPISPEGTFNFYAQINNKLRETLGANYNFQITLNNQLYHFSFEFKPHPFSHNLIQAISKICSCGNHTELFNKLVGSWVVDQGVVFPFQDVFRDRKPEAQYRASNLNISRFTTKFPFSLKLIGYARCNPMEGAKAVEEVRNAVENLGLRGLKLHPRSDLWLDNITDPRVSNVLVQAARYSIPVIFDTRGKESILAIHQLVKNTRASLMKSQPELIPHLKVLIAHCAMGYIGDQDVYEVISDPQTFGEISMLHGKGSAEFYLSFKKWYTETNKNATGKQWSEHLIFGTDFPYFSAKHACDNIAFLLSQQFIANGGTIIDAENILGLNILKAFTDYSLPVIQYDPCLSSYVHFPTPAPPQNPNLAANILSRLIEEKVIDIPKINFMFSESFQNYQNEVLIHTHSNSESRADRKIKFLYMNFIKGRYQLFSNLIQSEVWNPLGYKYYNPSDKFLLLRNFPFKFMEDEAILYRSFRNLYT